MCFAFPPHLEVTDHILISGWLRMGGRCSVQTRHDCNASSTSRNVAEVQLFFSPTSYSSPNVTTWLGVLPLFPPQRKKPGPRRPVASIFLLHFPIHQHNTKGRLQKWNKHKEMLCSKPEKWHLGVQFSRKVRGQGKVFLKLLVISVKITPPSRS